MFFHALQHSLRVKPPHQPETVILTEYFLKRSNGRISKSAVMCSGTDFGTQDRVSLQTPLDTTRTSSNPRHQRVHAAAPQRVNTAAHTASSFWPSTGFFGGRYEFATAKSFAVAIAVPPPAR